jgi:hypothetical protein
MQSRTQFPVVSTSCAEVTAFTFWPQKKGEKDNDIQLTIAFRFSFVSFSDDVHRFVT